MDFRAIRFVWIGIVIRGRRMCVYSHACATLIPYVKWLSRRPEFRKCTRVERATPVVVRSRARTRFLKITRTSTTFYVLPILPFRFIRSFVSECPANTRNRTFVSIYFLTQLFAHEKGTRASMSKENRMPLEAGIHHPCRKALRRSRYIPA